MALVNVNNQSCKGVIAKPELMAAFMGEVSAWFFSWTLFKKDSTGLFNDTDQSLTWIRSVNVTIHLYTSSQSAFVI